MIDFLLYDYLEKIVSEQEEVLQKYQKVYGKDNREQIIGINAIQSIVRRALIDDQKEEPTYSWIGYGKKGYESIKLNNYKFDFDFIISVLSNVPGILILDKWAIVMVVLTIFSELRKCKVEMSQVMGVIVLFLHDNGYKRKQGKWINEAELKNKMLSEITEYIDENIVNQEFERSINGLLELKVIEIQEGNITLAEEVIV